MSLINDALRRAREAQQEVGATDVQEPEFRPVETEEYESPPRSLTMPIGFALAGLVGLVILWRSFSGSGGADEAAPTIVSARAPAASSAAPAPAPEAATVDPDIAAAAQAEEAPVVVPRQAPAVPVPEVRPGPEPIAKKPRLQAVVYNPRKPSAILDGQTVFVGDRVGTLRVTQITRSGVVLSSTQERLVLTLP